VTYGYTSSGQIKVEPKDAIKERLGRSPDVGESLLLSLMEDCQAIPDDRSDRYRRARVRTRKRRGRHERPTPNERQAIKQFLHECTDLHIDGVDFAKLTSGVSMTVHYRDSQRPRAEEGISNPTRTTWRTSRTWQFLMSDGWCIRPRAPSRLVLIVHYRD
jgi:hypothetical protein